MIIGYARIGPDEKEASSSNQVSQLKSYGARRIILERAALRSATELDAALKTLSKGDEIAVSSLGTIVESAAALRRIMDRLQKAGASLHVCSIGYTFGSAPGNAAINFLLDDLSRAEARARREVDFVLSTSKTPPILKGGRPATARAKTADILALANKGSRPMEIAEQLQISVASVYRFLRSHRASKVSGVLKPRA